MMENLYNMHAFSKRCTYSEFSKAEIVQRKCQCISLYALEQYFQARALSPLTVLVALRVAFLVTLGKTSSSRGSSLGVREVIPDPQLKQACAR